MAYRKWHEMRCLMYDDANKPPLLIPNPFKSYLNLGLMNRLDQLRHENGWSMKEFAFRSDIALSTLRDLIHGRNFPLYVHLLNLATMSGTDIEYWKGLCPDGYRMEPNRMIINRDAYISVKGGTLEFVPRHERKA